MFDIDRWAEIYQTLSKNKLRSALTAFGVIWGIIMLIVMLGAGSGLQNGVESDFSGRVANSVFMWSNTTSIPYKGFKKNRWFSLTNDDTRALEDLPGLDLISPGLQLGGWRGANNVTYKNRTGAFEINGFAPDVQYIKLLKMQTGRFLNDRDLSEFRKVCVIGKITTSVLFPDEDPIGKYIQISGVYFQVVGTFHSGLNGDNAEDEDRSIYIPFTTFQKAFNQGNSVHWFTLTSKNGVDINDLEADAKMLLKKRHDVHPDDPRAIGAWNMSKEVEKFNMIFTGIKALSWFVGTLTLLAGVIGISNIMLIIIRERTQEIGVRRALGATPVSIVIQIVLESMILTTFSGILGIIFGVWLLEFLGPYIQHDYFSNPEVQFSTVFTAFGILIISGVLAGIIPSLRAVNIKPIEALRTE
ncbi:MAG: ABC transporter permease [Salibacteraceae bacterium]